MRAVQVTESFGLGRLTDVDLPDPEPAAGEVVVRLRAAALNYRDLLMVKGEYDPRQPLPFVPVSDGVGVVVATGAGVSSLEPGARVCPVLLPDWPAGEPARAGIRTGLGGPRPGVLSELRGARAEHVVRVPEHLTDAQAATLPCAALTAWSALVTLGGVVAGDVVLVQGTGGVSIFALQFAKLLGARVIVTSSSDAKLERAQQLGADECINYKKDPNWGDVARKMTGKRGVDHVVEVGGAGTLEQSLRAVRPGGTLSVIGVLAGGAAPLSVLPILMNQVRLQGVFCGHTASFEAMNRAIASSGLEPVVDTTFGFDAAGLRAGLEHLAAGRHFGKIALVPSA